MLVSQDGRENHKTNEENVSDPLIGTSQEHSSQQSNNSVHSSSDNTFFSI